MTSFNSQPTLKGETLELRPLKESDFESLYAIASDPLLWEQHPMSNRYQRDIYRALFDEFIATQGTLLILRSSDQKVIGSSRYYDLRPESVAIGFTMIAREFWGGALNRELKSLMLNHAFQHFSEVIFHVGENNLRSQKALEKIGATRFDESSRRLPDQRLIRQFHYRIKR